jgi:lipoate-protein ligase A
LMIFELPLTLDRFIHNPKLLFSRSTLPAFNLALEEYLFSLSGEYLLLYVNQPCVVLGYNQAVLNEVDLDYCIENDIRIIRRLSGGGAVYHDQGNLNYTFITDKGETPVSGEFLLPVIAVLGQLGIPVEAGKRKDLWLPGGFKVSGTASHVSKGRVLHHGTLLYETDLEQLHRSLNPERRDLVAKATASVPSPVKNISAFLKEERIDPPSFTQFAERFATQMMRHLEIDGITPLSPADEERIEVLRRSKYAQREWNYRM